MLYLYMIIAGVVVGLVVGLLASDRYKELSLTIATFRGSNVVRKVEMTGSAFYATISNYKLTKETEVRGSSIGSLQYNISKQFKLWAIKELGRKYNEHDKGWKIVNCDVLYDDEPLKESEFYRLTTKKMRSKKNPIVGYYHSDGLDPFYGPSDYPIRAKL